MTQRGPWNDVLFSWLHLSDIHVGQGDVAYGWDQRLVLQALREDAENLVRSRRVPAPQTVFVTGDIAFSGATRSATEYAGASQWLSSIATAIGLSNDDVLVVPGNHDVQRSVDAADTEVAELVRALREGTQSLDAVLADAAKASLLRKRIANYLTFADQFAPASREDRTAAARGFCWRLGRAVEGLRLRVVGLNTALLAADDEDRGRLRLGGPQMGHALLNDGAPPALTIVLSHHPLQGGWLADEKAASTWLQNHAQVHLSGHIHEARAEQVVTGGGRRHLAVTAGAAHGDAASGGLPASHGYNFGALTRSNAGIGLAVWPRRWSPGNAQFRLDVDNVLDGQEHSRHELFTSRAAPSPGPPPSLGPPQKTNLAELLAKLPALESFSARSLLLDRIPSRRALNRSESSKLVDLQLMVAQLRDLRLSDGTPCLAILIENALPFAAGTDVEDALGRARAAGV
jgi:hypothetical protein